MHDSEHCLETWFRTRRKSLVEAFTSKPRVLGYLRHSPGFGHITNRAKKFIAIPIGQDLGQILTDSLVTIQQRRHVKCDERLAHVQTSCASFFARRISKTCEDLSPAANRMTTTPLRKM